MPAAPPVFGRPGTVRNPKKVAWLSLATLGIYGLVWFYKFGKELDEAGRFGLGPKKYYTQLAILAGILITLPVALIHFFVYAFQAARLLEILAVRAGLTTVDVQDKFGLLVIPFAGVIYIAMLQRAANQVWAKMPKTAG